MVVDTMVLAYTLLGVEEYKQQAWQALASAESLEAPDSLKAELTNVVWQWIMYRRVPLQLGQEVLTDSLGLIDRYVPVENCWQVALELAVSSGHSAYDTLFIATAELLDTSCMTADQKLHKVFPQHTILIA